MAAQILRKGQAIVWVPPRAIGERAFANEAVLLAMLPTAGTAKRASGASPAGSAPAGSGGTARYQRLSLEALPALKSVTLVFDARDVTLLRATVPPLSGSRLQQALPNIVEDLLLQDAQLCGFALGPKLGEGERLIAAIDLQWLEHVVGAFERRGARLTAAWPAQLALPLDNAEAALCCMNDGLALRIGALDGIGWSGSEEPAHRHEAIVSLLQSALPEAREALAPADGGVDAPPAASAFADPGLAVEAAGTPLSSVPAVRRIPVYLEDADWRPAVEGAVAQLGITAEMHALPLPQASPIDLLGARRGSAARRWLADVDWRAWRVPAAFALATIVLGLVGLNLQWGMLAQERDALRAAIEQRYRQAFPETQVIVDPVLQMERQVSTLRTAAGQSGPEDFVPLLARFSQALGGQATDSLAGIEFRDGRLRIRFQPGSFDSQAVRNSLVQASQRLGLELRFDSEREPTASVGLLR